MTDKTFRVRFFDPSPDYKCHRVLVPGDGVETAEELMAQLPEGAQAAEIVDVLDLPPRPGPSPADQIATLERQSGMVKAVRKFMLTAMENEAVKFGESQGLMPQQALALLASRNPGYAAVKALDNQIEALEALL